MKKIFILLVLFTLIAGKTYAQDENDIVKMEINGNVYNYEPKVSLVYSTKNKIKIEKNCNSHYFEKNPISNFDEGIKRTFDITRIQQLAENRHGITFKFYCDSKGNVLEISFYIHGLVISEKGNENSLSLKEIELLNKVLKKCKVDLKNPCSDVKNYYAMRVMKFSDLE